MSLSVAASRPGTAISWANREPEQPQLSPHNNGCYNTSITAIIRYLQRLFLQNSAELTTLNDIGPPPDCPRIVFRFPFSLSFFIPLPFFCHSERREETTFDEVNLLAQSVDVFRCFTMFSMTVGQVVQGFRTDSPENEHLCTFFKKKLAERLQIQKKAVPLFPKDQPSAA